MRRAAILAATRVPRAVPRCWSLAVAGTWSLFLSLLVVSLPHAVTDALVSAIGAYALGFGVLVSIAASATPPVRLRPRCLDGPDPPTQSG